MGRGARWLESGARLGLLLAGLALYAPADLTAQYFGRNKVQYDVFDWRVAQSERFDIHFYPEMAEAARDASRMADRWYTRLSGILGHEFTRMPMILYADHPDFQQTNVITGFIGEGIGGVTEGLRTRVIMPFTGSYGDFNHVLGHEIVHVFQYDMARGPGAAGQGGLARLPLFIIEGMAEYLSVGRADSHTAMWLRDAALREDLPTIRDLTRDPRFFPYRYGQAMWAYIGGVYGDSVVGPLFRAAMRQGWSAALPEVLGVTEEELSQSWIESIRTTYGPLMAGRSAPTDVGRPALADAGPDEMNVSPVLSPDGRYFAFFSSRELFTIDLFVADARTGQVIRRLAGPRESPHFDALSFINSGGSWSPDGERLAFVVFADGDNQLAILNTATNRVERQFGVEGVGAIMNPAWSPDGRTIAFSGMRGGLSNLYLLDLETEAVRQLTNDRYAALQPAWSPDGRTLAYVTDQGPGTDLELLTFAPMRLALLDIATGSSRVLPGFEGVRHINPQFSPDGQSLYFVADREGFSDVYRQLLTTGERFQVTRLATGVSGISALSPALSVAARTGEMMISVFEGGRYRLLALPPDQTAGETLAAAPAGIAPGGLLPPVGAVDRVERYLADARGGLPAATRELPITDYRPTLGLLAIGPPAIGVSTDPYYGTMVGGGASAVFSDMLGDRMVAAAVYGSGSLQDIGGQLFYRNLERRWNWGAGLSRTPLLSGRTTVRDTIVTIPAGTVPARIIGQTLERVFLTQATGVYQYPFTTTRRFELNGGYTRLSFAAETEEILVVGNQVVGQPRLFDRPVPEPMHFFQTAGALVGDNSFHGYTSPVAGQRYRVEATPTLGTLTYYSLLGDYRRYFFPRPLTLALRGLTFGRYGRHAEDDRLSPLFVGYPTLVRGYSPETFSAAECTRTPEVSGCPEFDRLIGSRMAVANLELRVPLFGTEAFGIIDFPWLPLELAPFVDAGIAWTRTESPVLRFDTDSPERVPVVSTGVSARINVLGYVIADIYYVHPFQRPARGSHWGFQLAPGW